MQKLLFWKINIGLLSHESRCPLIEKHVLGSFSGWLKPGAVCDEVQCPPHVVHCACEHRSLFLIIAIFKLFIIIILHQAALQCTVSAFALNSTVNYSYIIMFNSHNPSECFLDSVRDLFNANTNFTNCNCFYTLLHGINVAKHSKIGQICLPTILYFLS